MLQRAEADPNTLHPQEILQLQQSIGNRAVTQLLQGQIRPPAVTSTAREQPEIQATPARRPLIQRMLSEEGLRQTAGGSNDFVLNENNEVDVKFTESQLDELAKAAKVLADHNSALELNILNSLDSAMSKMDAKEEITAVTLGKAYRSVSSFFDRLQAPGLSPVTTQPEKVEEEGAGDSLETLIDKLNLPLEKAQEIQAHVKAYHQSRYYHMTRPGNLESITKTGLQPHYGGTDRGLSAAHSDKWTAELYKANSKGHVHLGKDYFAIKGMESTLTDKYRDEEPQYLRAFLSFEEKLRLDVDRDVDKLSPFGSQARAVKTPHPITPNQIDQGNFSKLSQEKQLEICQRIREFYPDPQPSVKQVVKNHQFALENQLIFTDDPNPYRAKSKNARRYSL